MDGSKNGPQSHAGPSHPKHERDSFSFEPGVESPYRRKNRSVQSCTRCRARKTKCDRKFPCGPCSLRGEADMCVEYIKEKSEKPTGYTHLADFQVLVKRVESMEGVVNALQNQNQELRSRLGIAMPSTDHPNLSPPLASAASLTYESRQSNDEASSHDDKAIFNEQSMNSIGGSSFVVPGLVQPKPKPFDHNFGRRTGENSKAGTVYSDAYMNSDPVSRAPSRAEHDAALTLEDLALARGSNIQRSTQAKNLFGHIEGAFDKTAGNSPAPFMVTSRLPNLYLLPGTSQAQVIIDFYLNKVDWLIRCIHVPTFRAQCADFWAQDPKDPLTPSQLSFLPLYCACLALSLHLMESKDTKGLGYDDDAEIKMPKLWWELGFAAMEKMDWMQTHSMGSLQAIIVIGAFFASINRGEYHWTLLGTANKIAQNMGLSRLGAEPTDPHVTVEAISKRFGSRWVSAVDREVGRRVWANLVELDITFSIEKCMTYSIHERQHKAVEPANVDDEDLQGHGPIIGKPTDVHTDMSFVLERLRLMYPIQKLVGRINEAGRVKYSFIMEAHQEYSHIISTTPSCWREDVDLRGRYDAATLAKIQIERIVLSNATCLRLLRVHRIYLSSAYQSSKYSLSREVCLSCARSLVRSGDSPITCFPKPQRYWPITYGIFCACIVLFFELCRATSEDAPRAREELVQAIGVLRENAGNHAFQASANALEKLMNEESSQRSMRGKTRNVGPAGVNKRKREDDPGDSVLNRLVKRVILFNSPQQTNSIESPGSTVGGQLPSPIGGGSSVVSRAIPSASVMSSNLDMSTGHTAGMGDDWSIEQSLADDLFNYEDPAVYQILQYTLNADALNMDSLQGMAPSNMDTYPWDNGGGFDLFAGANNHGNGSGQGW